MTFWGLARGSGAAIYAAAYAWYPEILGRFYLEGRTEKMPPLPDDSQTQFCGIAFALNLAFRFGLLMLFALTRLGSR